MPYRRLAEEKEIVDADALALLGRVFDRTSVDSETQADRDARASRIIAYYLIGIRDEAELVTLAKRALSR